MRSNMGTCNSKDAGSIISQHTIDVYASGDSVLDGTVHNFRKGLPWYRKDCHVNEVYDVVEVIGEGSMGEVSIVKKKVNSSMNTIIKNSAPDLNSALKYSVGSAPSVPSPRTGRLFACKTVVTSYMTEVEMDEFINEIDIMRDFDHPNIVQLFEVYRVRRKIWIIMELCTGGDLESRIDTMTEERLAVAMEQLFSGLAYMHLRNVSHRDLKLENIMYENEKDDAAIKLIDFGLSQHITQNEKMSRAVGTIYTVAPEVLIGQSYTAQSDIWSAGVIAFVLLSGEYPFLKTTNELEDETKVSALLGARYSMGAVWQEREISTLAKQFIGNSLRRLPGLRWTAKEALHFIQTKWIPHLAEKSSDEKSLAISKKHSLQNLNILSKSTALKRKRVKVKSNLVRAMRKFGEYGEMKRTILMTLAYTMDKSSLGYLKDLFLSFDSENNGTLSLGELKLALREYSQTVILTDDEIATMFMGMDYDQSGQIHYIEFLAVVAECQGLVTIENLSEAFDRLDSDNSGVISRENLISILGTDHDDNRVMSMIKEAGGMNKTGQIDYSQFLKLMYAEEASFKPQ